MKKFADWLREWAATVTSPRDDTAAVIDAMADLCAQQHEVSECFDDIQKLSIKESQEKWPGIPRSYGEALDWWNEHKLQPALKAAKAFQEKFQ